jgi:hypothetical protein
MSKWINQLTQAQAINHYYDLEERAAIMEYDGKETESEYLAISMFVKANMDRLQKYIAKDSNGNFFLELYIPPAKYPDM